jgi:hypothetical protein
MLFLPRIDPIRDATAIALDIAVLLAIQFHHDLLVVRFARFFEENAEDLGVEVLLQLFFVVASARKIEN